jgi:hypothetical protein
LHRQAGLLVTQGRIGLQAAQAGRQCPQPVNLFLVLTPLPSQHTQLVAQGCHPLLRFGQLPARAASLGEVLLALLAKDSQQLAAQVAGQHAPDLGLQRCLQIALQLGGRRLIQKRLALGQPQKATQPLVLTLRRTFLR